jgi:trimeric autotransporter adhesin
MKTTIPFFSLVFAVLCVIVSPQAHATCQEGCFTNNNTVLGEDVLINNTNGFANTAIGSNTLHENTTGNGNTATGNFALFLNTIGYDNTANGDQALINNTSGFANTATGEDALLSNTTGSYNTATGRAALTGNSTGTRNTANGVNALWSNNGNDNTATGNSALSSNLTGSGNTGNGVAALSSKYYGDNNIAVGFHAGINLSTGSNNIYVGNLGVRSESGVIRIGTTGTHTKTFIAGISGGTVPTGVAIIVDGSGHLGTTTSSARFKEAIKPMENASEVILALKPVTFRYKKDLDPDGIAQFGLVAEEVEKVNSDLVARDDDGKPYSVRYEAVNAMLLNEFLKEHREVQEQKAMIARLQKQVETLTAGFEKVSAQLELSKPAPRTVLNNR